MTARAVVQPDHRLREGFRVVSVLGLPERAVRCDACGYPFDPVLAVCPGCGVAA